MYGRRLVLEWAAQDESIDDLRAKTARLASASRGNEGGDGDSQGNSTKKKLQRYFQTRPAKANNDEEEDDE